MANKRIISSSMWEDEFFTALPLFDRLLWVGLITCAADDQGRMQDNPALIRSKVFPLDDVKISDVDTALCNFKTVGKIDRYIANNKHAIQIVNWWKHQAPNWAGRSLLPAPDGWVDRERFHGKNDANGKQTIITVSWDSKGGYIDGYIANNIDTKDSPNDRHDIKGEVKGEVEGEDCATPPSPFVRTAPNEKALSMETIAQKIYSGVTGFPVMNEAAVKCIDMIYSVYMDGGGKTIQSTIDYMKPYYSNWCKSINASTRKSYSKLGTGWIEWVMEGDLHDDAPKIQTGRRYPEMISHLPGENDVLG